MTAAATNVASPAVQTLLQRGFPPAVVDLLDADAAVAAETAIVRRRRDFPPLSTVAALVLQAWEGRSLAAATQAVAASTGRSCNARSGALCRGRQRCPAAFAAALAKDAARHAAAGLTGRRLLGLDGTCLALADTAANQAAYPQSSRQRPGCGRPQLHAVALADLRTGAVLDLACGTLADHDARLGAQLWDRLEPGDLLVADRGFASYGLLANLSRRGVDLVVRQHHRQHNTVAPPQAVGAVVEVDEVWTRPAKSPAWWGDDLPPRLVVRVVMRRVSADRLLVLNTTLPRETHDAAQVLALYARRWSHETHFRELKVALGWEPVAAHRPATVRVTVWATVLAHNLVCGLLTQAAVAYGRDRQRLSYQAALDTLRVSFRWPSRSPEEVGNWVRWELTRYPLARREPGRYEPRAVKRRLRKWPEMLVHTRQELRDDPKRHAA